MKRILTLSVCLFVHATFASAQKFMDQIEQVAEGQGMVKIHQDALLTKIVNGEFIPTEKSDDDNKNSRMRVKRRGYRIHPHILYTAWYGFIYTQEVLELINNQCILTLHSIAHQLLKKFTE